MKKNSTKSCVVTKPVPTSQPANTIVMEGTKIKGPNTTKAIPEKGLVK